MSGAGVVFQETRGRGTIERDRFLLAREGTLEQNMGGRGRSLEAYQVSSVLCQRESAFALVPRLFLGGCGQARPLTRDRDLVGRLCFLFLL